MDIKLPLITFISFVVLPTYSAMYCFRLFGLPIRSSLSRTIQANFLLFGVMAVIPIYWLYFELSPQISWLTPIRTLFSPDKFKDVSSDRLQLWMWVVVKYNLCCFAYFFVLASLVKQFVFRREFGECIAGLLGSVFEAAEIWSGADTIFQAGRDKNTHLILDILSGDGKVLYSGFFAGFSDRESFEGSGLFLKKVKKFAHDGTAVSDSEESQGLLNRMFFPWQSISNVNLRNVAAGDVGKIRQSLKAKMEEAKKKHRPKKDK